jgi:hydroxypyruvate reductase
VSDHIEPVPTGARLLIGAHPIPDDSSLAAGRALLDFVRALPSEHMLLVLVSGGGSALAEVPVEGLTIDHVADLGSRLMDAATPIDELNIVRRHLSQLKNGGLLRGASTRQVISLLMSDVIDGDASVIASGPTLADDSTADRARSIIESRLGIAAPQLIEAAHDQDHDHQWFVVADCGLAAREAAITVGGTVWRSALRGEASEMAVAMLRALEDRPLVAAGETTVTVRGTGRGGRNQEAALAAALFLEGRDGLFAALGTDGIDGPTDAAGAIIDGGSTGRMRSAGVDPRAALADNDAYTALEASGDLVITGPSGTNVGDLWIATP